MVRSLDKTAVSRTGDQTFGRAQDGVVLLRRERSHRRFRSQATHRVRAVLRAASNVADFITPPDAIWVFRPNGNDVASDLGIAGSSNWSGKRIHQYCAGGSTQICPSPASLTYGGVTLGTSPNQGIDLDVEDGPVVSLSGAGPTSLSFTLTQTSFPTSTAPYTASIPATGSSFTNLNKVYLV